MITERQFAVGIKYDGVLMAPEGEGTHLIVGALRGLHELQIAEDVEILGVQVNAHNVSRAQATQQELENLGLHLELIQTEHMPKEKLENLLQECVASKGGKLIRHGGYYVTWDSLERIVVIDNNPEEIIEAAGEIGRDPEAEFKHLLPLLTVVAFDPNQEEEVKGLILPEAVHVISMRGWDDVQGMLERLRGGSADLASSA